MMGTKSLSPQEQLDIIETLVQEARRSFIYTGYASMVWGTLVPLGVVLTYFLVGRAWFGFIGPLWLSVCVVGIVLVARYYHKIRGKQKKTVLVERMVSNLWVFVLGLCLLAGVFAWLFPSFLSLPHLFCCVSLLVATGYWASSVLTAYVLLKLVAGAWVVQAFVVFWIPLYWSSLSMGIWAFVFEALPGLYLYVKERQQSRSSI
ncbi:hypothetical protein [Gracilinema caldarium]|uniref:hypothetical protein n=1 Tax=Gracilinema caldarium TaxID=215591 RepID=UPI0026EF89E4|nr:hypothetical protein [Gracilinema caldarium]